MSIRRLADRHIGLEEDCEPLTQDATHDLILALKELLDRLSEQSHGGSLGEPEEVESWEDGGYLYVEAGLTGVANAEIDVNIQRGRAYIRMAR